MHVGAGAFLRTWLPRAPTWQRIVVAIAMLAVGAVLFALGDVRAGIVGVLGLLILSGVVRNRLGRARRTTSPHVDLHDRSMHAGTAKEEQP
ncbi:MAG TPA: hypothetical protein VND62_03325 [Acidimicrobiales bacterium]|nr:hypothetical protein [Acidimicrobiales bacterium]